jgi:hypothetical protein
MNDIMPFTAPFAVFKVTMAPRRKRPDVWAGHLIDSSKRKVVWDTGPPTTYGPSSTEDQAFYSDACLAEDVANGRHLYEAVAKLLSQPPQLPAVIEEEEDAEEEEEEEVMVAQRPVDTAIETAAKYYYSKDPPKKRPVWLAWLEGCIRADTGKLFHFLPLPR